MATPIRAGKIIEIVGYQVLNENKDAWGDRASFEILSISIARKDLAEAKAAGLGAWEIVPVSDGDIEDPTFIGF